MHFVYVLRSTKDKKLYVGCAADVAKRFASHNAGAVRSTCHRKPLELLYTEPHADKYEAFRRERYYKTPQGKRELKKLLGDRLTVGHQVLVLSI